MKARTMTERDVVPVDDRLFVGSVQKAMLVMEAFDQNNRMMSISEIAEKTGLGRSAAQRFAYTFERIGYLRRDPESRKYGLSNRVLRFVQGVLSANSALESSFHLLAQLAEKTEETVSWVELDGDEIVIMSSVPSPHRSAITLPVGSRYSTLSSSSGQVFLAHAPENEVRAVFDKASSGSHKRIDNMTFEQFMEYLAAVKHQGYSLTEKDLDFGSLSASVPLFNYRGKLIAAINLSALRVRHSSESMKDAILPLLQDTAKAVSSLIVS
ncbi:helix-turn-helix domain-containing protein [Rhizobium leguminosarum bv. viciae]|nr:helix-turn-helix domain-containing protein [Rhizobium leguminosarum bv. viciae]